MRVPDCIEKDEDMDDYLGDILDSLPSLGDMESCAAIYHALSDINRLKVLNILSDRELCVCLIKELINLSGSKLSYHLSVLKRSGLIEGRSSGKWILYRLTALGLEFMDVSGKRALTEYLSRAPLQGPLASAEEVST